MIYDFEKINIKTNAEKLRASNILIVTKFFNIDIKKKRSFLRIALSQIV